MVSLIDLLSNTYAPIQTMILPYLDIGDVISLTLTCKGFDQLQPTLMATAYDINRLLGNFFDNPLEFRSLQGKCEAIIAGDAIQGWFHRSTASGSHTLKIYVYEEHSSTIIDYVESNGYQETTRKSGWIVYGCTATILKRRIVIRVDVGVPVAQLCYDSWFTSDLCFITWNKAYALFPYTTFIRRECYTLKDPCTVDMRQATCVEEGLSVKTVSWTHPYAGSVNDNDLLGILSLSRECEDIKELARRRKIGDEHTWSIELGIRGLDESNNVGASLESCTFRLCVWDEKPGIKPAHYEFHDGGFTHVLLKRGYMILEKSAETSYYSVMWEALWCRLNELTLVELSKIPPERRPALYSEIVQNIGMVDILEDSEFIPPDTWKYYDDEVIAFLDKIWKIQRRMDRKEEASRKKQFEAFMI